MCAARPAEAVAGRTRPVYPYPFVAKWNGSDDHDDAASYARGDTGAAVEVPDWAGSDFYGSYVAPRG